MDVSEITSLLSSLQLLKFAIKLYQPCIKAYSTQHQQQLSSCGQDILQDILIEQRLGQ